MNNAPWKADSADGVNWTVHDADGRTLAIIAPKTTYKKGKGYELLPQSELAHLLAAAPDMLEALKKSEIYVSIEAQPNTERGLRARAVLLEIQATITKALEN